MRAGQAQAVVRGCIIDIDTTTKLNKDPPKAGKKAGKMERYILLFIGGKVPDDLVEQNSEEWSDWIVMLGTKGVLVDAGAPFGLDGSVISNVDKIHEYDWHKDSNVSGYAVIQAEDIEVAVELAKTCPQLAKQYGSGVIEVRQLAEML